MDMLKIKTEQCLKHYKYIYLFFIFFKGHVKKTKKDRDIKLDKITFVYVTLICYFICNLCFYFLFFYCFFHYSFTALGALIAKMDTSEGNLGQI